LIILFIIVCYFQITFIKGFCFVFRSFCVCYPTLRNKIETFADGYSVWSNCSLQSCFGNTIFNFFNLYQFTILLQITEISISAKLVLCVRLFCACFEGLCRYYFSSSAAFSSLLQTEEYCKHLGSWAGGAWQGSLLLTSTVERALMKDSRRVLSTDST
jgi:hypothetical protein